MKGEYFGECDLPETCVTVIIKIYTYFCSAFEKRGTISLPWPARVCSLCFDSLSVPESPPKKVKVNQSEWNGCYTRGIVTMYITWLRPSWIFVVFHLVQEFAADQWYFDLHLIKVFQWYVCTALTFVIKAILRVHCKWQMVLLV